MLQCPTCGRRYSSDVQTCPSDGTPLRADATVAGSADVNSASNGATFNPSSNSNTESLLGAVLDDKYRLDALLGVGGMGTVYQATHLLIERRVAVKVLNPLLVSDPAAQERLRREARAAGRLRHTNAVAVTDFGQTRDGIVYIVMELLEGISLRELLAREAPLAPPHGVGLMLQTSAAVAAAHELGIIHRDLKPGNIFIVERPHAAPIVKVLDFGIAKVASETDVTHAQTLTETGMMIGTPRYMSPEQCDGTPLTPASDVYSLGILLYEMLAGAPPFTGSTPLAVALKHSSETPRPLREIVPNVPPALEQVVLHALAKNPEERPPDAGAFRHELHRAAQAAKLDIASGFSDPTSEFTNDEREQTSFAALAPTTIENPNAVETVGKRPPQVQEMEASAASQSKSTIDQPAVDDMKAGNAPGKSNHVRPRRTLQPPGRAATRATSPRAQTLGAFLARRPVLLLGGLAALLLLCVLAFALTRYSSSPTTTGSDASSTADGMSQSVGRSLTPNEQASGSAEVEPKSEPQSAVDFNERGAYYFNRRAYDSAERDFRRAIELQKPFAAAHNRLGQTLVAKGQFARAIAEFQQAVVESDGNFPIAQYNLGFALNRAGNRDAAVKAYEEAIAQSVGNYPDAEFQIGLILLNKGRNADAADSFRRTIEASKGQDAEANYYLGVALARQKDFTSAEEALRKAIEQRGGEYPDAYYTLGLLYENNRRFADAVRAYETYLQQQPDAPSRRKLESDLRELRRRVGNEEDATNEGKADQ